MYKNAVAAAFARVSDPGITTAKPPAPVLMQLNRMSRQRIITAGFVRWENGRVTRNSRAVTWMVLDEGVPKIQVIQSESRMYDVDSGSE